MGGTLNSDHSAVGGIGSARGINRLTEKAVKVWLAKRQKGEAVPKMLSDGGGLALHLTAAGTPVWRIKYRLGRTEKEHSAGVYPDVSLAAAREARAAVQAQRRDGMNPAAELRKAKAAAVLAADHSVRAVADQWLERQRPGWSKIHYAKSRRALERDVYPTLGSVPVEDVTPGMVGAVIQRVIDRGVRETASRILEHISCIFDYASALDLRSDNPATAARQLLPKRRSVRRHPALLELNALREILRRCDALPISPPVRLANRLLAFSAVRPGNAIAAEWSEFQLDGDTPTWTIPRAKMKMKDPEKGDFVVYLAPTIATELRAWRAATRAKGFCFPSPTGEQQHVTVEALDRLYSRTLELSGKHSPHGWRSALRSLAGESQLFNRDVLETALDHGRGTRTEQAYNRAQWEAERKRLATWWDAQLTSGAL